MSSSHKKGEVPAAKMEVEIPTGSTSKVEDGYEPINQERRYKILTMKSRCWEEREWTKMVDLVVSRVKMRYRL